MKIPLNYSKILIPEITTAGVFKWKLSRPAGKRLNREGESSDHLTGACDGKIPSGPDEVARQRNEAFLPPVAMAPFLPIGSEVKVSALRAIPTTTRPRSLRVFNHLGMAGFLH